MQLTLSPVTQGAKLLERISEAARKSIWWSPGIRILRTQYYLGIQRRARSAQCAIPKASCGRHGGTGAEARIASAIFFRAHWALLAERLRVPFERAQNHDIDVKRQEVLVSPVIGSFHSRSKSQLRLWAAWCGGTKSPPAGKLDSGPALGPRRDITLLQLAGCRRLLLRGCGRAPYGSGI